MPSAADEWRELLDGWAIPEHILEVAPEPPWGFDVRRFRARVDESRNAETPSRRAALESLPEGGSVLDVGSGAGAASLPLAPQAGLLVAVDESPGMLQAFAEEAEHRRVAHREIQGTWPGVAPRCDTADVVLCHHVFYNVRQIRPFVRALTDHARTRVVVEITAAHPMMNLTPLWRHFHGIDRPPGPTSAQAAAVLRELGIDFRMHRWDSTPWKEAEDRRSLVAGVRKRLCLPADRDEEIDDLLPDDFSIPPSRLVTIWWDAGRERRPSTTPSSMARGASDPARDTW
jgi:SAM-dependent methyltransferase